MNSLLHRRSLGLLLRWIPLVLFVVLIATFGALSPRFLSIQNFGAILVQSSSLIVVALGMNFVLLTAGVDLSVGAAMYVVAVIVGMHFGQSPVWVCLLVSIPVGASFGLLNSELIARLGLPAFITTLATLFIGRGVGLFLSSTQIAYAGPAVAGLGRAAPLGVPGPLWIAGGSLVVAWVLLNRTPLGPYVRCVGANAESARRAGVPTVAVLRGVYVLCGAFAGLSGFTLLCLTSAASGAFGQGTEFLAIAAAVLGGTSLFGGRGGLWAPVVGAVLITTVQNGLVMIDADPYSYPVITGAVIFFAALLDSVRAHLRGRMGRRVIRPKQPEAVSLSWHSSQTKG